MPAPRAAPGVPGTLPGAAWTGGLSETIGSWPRWPMQAAIPMSAGPPVPTGDTPDPAATS